MWYRILYIGTRGGLLAAPESWWVPLERVEGSETLASPPGGPEPPGELVALAKACGSRALLVHAGGEPAACWYAEGFSPEQRFNSWSMHKAVQSLLVGIAIDEGAIGSVEDPVGRYFPPWRSDPRGKIPLRSLLDMSSGLENPGWGPRALNPEWRLWFGRDVPGAVAGRRSERPAGERFDYNNANSELLVAVLEQASGSRYADYLATRLWRPLGNRPARLALDRPGGHARGFACLFATAADWLRIGLLLLNEGRAGHRQIVPAAWIRDMRSPSRAHPNFGYHVWLGSPHLPRRTYTPASATAILAAAPYRAPDLYFLDGIGGNRVYVVPSRDLVAVAVGGQLRDDWDDARLPNALLDLLAAPREEARHA